MNIVARLRIEYDFAMRDNVLVLLVAAGLLGGLVTAFVSSGRSDNHNASHEIDGLAALPWAQTGDAIGTLRLEGPIMDTGALVRTVERWRKDDSIKGILLTINSPGGAVAPSQALYDALLAARDTKPVYAVIESIGASGGYYVASAAQKIYASRGSLVGSIGVIMQTMEWSRAADKLGISANTIKTGKFKDLGNPFRPMSVTEQAHLQKLADATHEQFVNDVHSARPVLELDKLRVLATGEVFTGTQAVDNKLIDAMGTPVAALRDLAEATGLDTEQTPTRRPRPDWEEFENWFDAIPKGMHALSWQSLPVAAIWLGAEILAQ